MQCPRIFQVWFCLALTLWAVLVARLLDLSFVAAHWFYPATMVLGGFVAGITPEGGGAVAFPMLSVFFEVERLQPQPCRAQHRTTRLLQPAKSVLGENNRQHHLSGHSDGSLRRDPRPPGAGARQEGVLVG